MCLCEKRWCYETNGCPKVPLHILCLSDRRQTVSSPLFSLTPPDYTNYSGPRLNVSCLKVKKEKVTDE